EMLSGLTLVSGALHSVVEVRNHADGDKRMTIAVEVNTPGVTAAFGKDLKLMLGGMIPPDPRIDLRALGIRRAGFAHIGVGKYAMRTVQPAIRPPAKIVQHFVSIIGTPSVKEFLGRTCGLVGVVI